jgi:hypothetical protein
MKTLAWFAAVLTLGMSVLSIPSLANAQTTIDVGDTAPLLAKGAAANVPVEITCVTPTTNVQISVNVVQRTGNITTNGGGFVSSGFGGSATISCSSSPQIVEVVVTVTSSGRIFKQGVALAHASIFECDPGFNTCNSANATKEIRLLH